MKLCYNKKKLQIYFKKKDIEIVMGSKLYMYEIIREFTNKQRGQTFKKEPINQFVLKLYAYIKLK